MNSIARRWLRSDDAERLTEASRPSYDIAEIQPVIVAYVVAESDREETASELLEWYIREHKGERARAVEAILALIAGGVLCIHDGKVVIFRMEHVAQAMLVGYVVIDKHHDKTIVGLREALAPDAEDVSIEQDVRELDRAELLTMNGSKVEPGRIAATEPQAG